MSSYVDALKRWRLEDQPHAALAAPLDTPAAPLSAYDLLHDRLQIAASDHPIRVLAFAGVSGGEGVGQVVVHYAERLAQSSSKVMVVLADTHVVRSSAVTSILDLVKLVTEGASPPLGERGLPCVVGLPGRYAGAGQLLTGSVFAAWLASQAAAFDQIVMEVPPALKYAETTVIGKHADGIVLVARAHVTQVADLAQAQRLLTRSAVRVFGVVLNQVQAPPPFLRRVLMPELSPES